MKYLVLIFCLLVPALACAPFYPSEFDGEVAAERALIVWDKEEGVQHFIRTADFDTQATKVGFVVPTPSQPSISAVSNDLFRQLHETSKPRIVYENVRDWSPGSFLALAGCSYTKSATIPRGSGSVELLERGKTAGQEYAVLKAGEVDALAEWLETNGFPFSQTHKLWARKYIDKGYYLTAFRFLSQDGNGFTTEAVQMTFKTDKPFYPYREPESVKPRPGRALRVYLLADEAMQGATANGPWSAEVTFSAEIPPLEQFSQKRLTCFVDKAETRTGLSDLFFSPNPSQAEVHPPDKVVTRRVSTPIPLDLIAVLLVGIGSWWWKNR